MKLCQYGVCSLLKYFYKPDSASSLATGYSGPHLGTSAMLLPPMVFVIMKDGVKNWGL